tara:strand:- start:364 stop:771 length:408 start_codon:yes stop_codon:yes gene_type:complete
MRIPEKEELIKAIFRMRSDAVIQECFGREWYKKADPRPLLPVTYEDFYNAYRKSGIPSSVLVERVWGGHEHFVIDKIDNEWCVGYAERGGATLESKHPSIESAREAVLKELWSLHVSAGNPSHWKDGVSEGTPYA